MQQKLPKRDEVAKELTWRLEDIYDDESKWESELNKVNELADKFASYQGKISKDSKSLLEVSKLAEEVELYLDRVYGYAHMREDQDTANSKYQGMKQRALSTYMAVSEKSAFIDPEILQISDADLEKFYAETPELDRYKRKIAETRRLKEHMLDAATEALLASAGEMQGASQKAYGMLANADLKFPSVKDSKGEEVQLSNGRFVPTQMSKDRDLRKASFEAFYGRYEEFKNTWAAMYDGEVKSRIFEAKARKYGSAFEAAVDHNDVSPAVCDSLFESIHDNMDKMHRYVTLRKKLLGVDELHMYDVYVGMLPDFDMKVSYEEAKELSLKALAPLGEDYLEVVKEAYENRWIDVVENEGKRGGAYSSGVYNVHPYMLLNYNDTLDDVFTLVHEMGHSMHTWYSNKAQTIVDAGYKIFVAEVASTTNEVLLYHYMKDNAKSKEEKAFIINHFLDSFKGTMFRQTMFEEFERKTCEMAEAGTPLTAESLYDVYLELNKQYFGKDMISDPQIGWEWCRIPHFYYNFYVYQYATSFAAAVAIADRILKEGKPAVDQYKKFLSSGCTQDPVSLLKIAGVDLTTKAPIDSALAVFGEAINEMEEITR
ncbi:oligoendopeptidase F [Butyrivibrio hungatei DSM 14810]|uniref:Oligopeptidase F n=1 Tax=Butyrivibrio hungatei DSM 14810 TaxID=1121132 RepID=A0A1M7SJN3_9FIRM|nr:oligoendopeptidase F [Butyrivibrio hungatei]SHN58660.1 oligoendopeptidase F [Butyrivibrio hungatei DSM 14810]